MLDCLLYRPSYVPYLAANNVYSATVATFSQAHQAAGHPSPTRDARVRTTLAGIRRTRGTAPSQKSPALTANVRAMVEALPDTLPGARDRTQD